MRAVSFAFYALALRSAPCVTEHCWKVGLEGASVIMAPRKFSGPIQQGAIRVRRDLEVASTSDIMPITHPRQHNPQHRSRSLRRVGSCRSGQARASSSTLRACPRQTYIRECKAQVGIRAVVPLLKGSEPKLAPMTVRLYKSPPWAKSSSLTVRKKRQ